MGLLMGKRTIMHVWIYVFYFFFFFIFENCYAKVDIRSNDRIYLANVFPQWFNTWNNRNDWDIINCAIEKGISVDLPLIGQYNFLNYTVRKKEGIMAKDMGIF